MIKRLSPADSPQAANLIRESFATVAKEIGFTEQDFPTFMGFSITPERLQTQFAWGWQMYGLYEGTRLVGYVSLSREAENTHELHNLAVLPPYRHRGYGKGLLDFCKGEIGDSGGTKIKLGIIEENTALKNWYAANGFTHTGTKKFDHMPITVGFMEWKVV